MSNRKLSKRQTRRIQSQQERQRVKATQDNSDLELNDHSMLGPETTGIVISHYGSQVDIEDRSEPLTKENVRCFVRANVDNLVTGDFVVWQPTDENSDRTGGVVVARQPRQSELIRPDNYGKLRPVAANIDRIGVVFAALPNPQSNLIDRYLVAAEAHDIQPFIVLNKADLLTDNHYPEIQQLIGNYESIGYRVFSVSAKTEDGIEELASYLSQYTSIFVGQSGVGKSSIINVLQPDNHSAVGELSEASQEGTHTTTASKLVHLNSGGLLIDSPGIREFALSHLDQEIIINGFRDFRPYLGRCKFRDCQHDKESGCALLAAVAEGEVLAERLQNYRQILKSLNSN
jgi:ribosome biogenesis GTPase